MSMAGWFYIGLFVIGVILFCCYSRTGRLLKCMFFTAFTGLPTLLLLWSLGKLVAIPLAVTPLSLLVSVLLGIPGLLTMLILNLLG